MRGVAKQGQVVDGPEPSTPVETRRDHDVRALTNDVEDNIDRLHRERDVTLSVGSGDEGDPRLDRPMQERPNPSAQRPEIDLGARVVVPVAATG